MGSEMCIRDSPESIIHSIVTFNDESSLAQMSVPDMCGAIGYAFNFPNRKKLPIEKLQLSKIGRLTFKKPNKKKFPALDIVEKVGMNLDLGVIFNAAKEVALDRFISGEIGFLDMANLVEKTLEESSLITRFKEAPQNVPEILELNDLTREVAKKLKF